jgi:hypothetical protein
MDRIYITKAATLPKVMYRFNIIFMKIPMAFLGEIEKSSLKLLLKT